VCHNFYSKQRQPNQRMKGEECFKKKKKLNASGIHTMDPADVKKRVLLGKKGKKLVLHKIRKKKK